MNKRRIGKIIVYILIIAFLAIFFMRATDLPPRGGDCRAEINQQLERMRIAIESTANSGSLEKINFNPPACFEGAKIELNAIEDRYICSNICKEGRDSCMLLDYFSKDYVRRVCVDIPLNTAFEDAAGVHCPDKRSSSTGEQFSYELVPFTQNKTGIPKGSYALTNRTPQNTTVPIICAYRLID